MAEGWSAPTPLRNSDFKALLATPRPAHAGGGGKPKHRGYANDGDEEAEERKPRFKKPSKGKPVKAKEGKDDEHQYRCVQRRGGGAAVCTRAVELLLPDGCEHLHAFCGAGTARASDARVYLWTMMNSKQNSRRAGLAQQL